MAVLTFSQPSSENGETSYYTDEEIDRSSSGWYMMDERSDEGSVVFGGIFGVGMIYDSYGTPVSGLVTSARCIDTEGQTRWTLSGIYVAASSTYSIENALGDNSPFSLRSTLLAGNDRIIGSSGNDYFEYTEGSDRIYGNAGIDHMDFDGKIPYGSDLKVDLRYSFYDVTLSSGTIVRSLIYGVENITGTYGDDIIFGNAANNRILSEDGNDYVNGGGGNDYISCGPDSAGDQDDIIYGGPGNDTIAGWCGDNLIDGGVGIDTLISYNTTYGVETNLALKRSSHSLGVDTVLNVENVIGTDWEDVIIGNAGGNMINGGHGNDILDGGAGSDTLDYRNGYRGCSVNLTTRISNGMGRDVVRNFENVLGSNYADVLVGTSVRNVISGNGGNDAILTVGGNDHLSGNSGNDTLDGGLGVDVLIGGTGNDILKGGAGKDFFVFNAPLNSLTNRDIVRDFMVVDDTIQLDRTIFSRLPALGTLNSAYFKASYTGKAMDSNDYILYNRTNGALLYDRDATGAGVAVQFATLTNKPALTSADFVVVA